MPAELRLRLQNTLGSLADAAERARAFLREHQVPATCVGQVMVIIDELGSNIVAYAWTDAAAHGFDLVLSLQQGGAGPEIVLTLDDDGMAFDPTLPRSIDLQSGLESLEVGGIGLAIVARTSDRFEYRRRDGRNQVLVGKRVPAA